MSQWQSDYGWNFENDNSESNVFNPKTPGYFDYDPTSDHGPKKWDKIDDHSNEFTLWVNKENNQCDGDFQSPVNVKSESTCKEDHKINTRRGARNFNTIEWAILPHALRANLDVDYSTPSSSARIDVSNLTEYIPAIFVEVKIPSEHSLFGKFYAGEFIISHFFDKGNGYFVNVSIMMDITDDQNVQLEQFIREWEEVSWKREARCHEYSYVRTYPTLNLYQMQKIWGVDKNWRSDYDLYALMTTMFHCGYEGSLTVPPCLERVHWRILDLPMKMSENQYGRIHDLIVNQLDTNCEYGSTNAFKGGVNRPLQKNENNVYCCSCDHFKMNGEDERQWLLNDKWPSDYDGRDCNRR